MLFTPAAIRPYRTRIDGVLSDAIGIKQDEFKVSASDRLSFEIKGTIANTLRVATSEFFDYFNRLVIFVEKQLKSPSTAKFPKTIEKNEHITNLGGGKYKINSWVDSQNAFGATIRTNFSCTIIFEGDNLYCSV